MQFYFYITQLKQTSYSNWINELDCTYIITLLLFD